MRFTHDSEIAARKAATAKLTTFQRGEAVLDLKTHGQPTVYAEARLNLTGVRSGVDGEWLITRVVHDFGNGGFTTAISAEAVAG